METAFAAVVNAVLIWWLLAGQVYLALGNRPARIHRGPDLALQNVLIGLIDDFLCHLYVAGGESSVDRKHSTRDPGRLV